MMLPTNMALVEDESFKTYVEVYTTDEALFQKVFVKAFGQLISLGCPAHCQPGAAGKLGTNKSPSANKDFRDLAMLHGSAERMKALQDDERTTPNEEFHDYTNECYITAATLFTPSKKQKKKHLSSITLGWMYNRKGSQKGKEFKFMRVLLDSGCGGTLINRSFVKKCKSTTLSKATNWTTKAGTFKTDRKVKCQFTLPEFHIGKDVSWNTCVGEIDASAICDFLRREDELMTELMNHKRSTSY
jgi:hypothetical protein